MGNWSKKITFNNTNRILNVEWDDGDLKQLEIANKSKAKFTLILGQKEVGAGFEAPAFQDRTYEICRCAGIGS